VATQTAPRDWWDEPPEVILTALAILEAQAEALKRARRGR
jgi:hypothetical protein